MPTASSLLILFYSSLFNFSTGVFFPRLTASFLSDMAGFLALSEKPAFPSIRAQWLFDGLSIMEMTVAGTAQDSHLIPFYAPVDHQHITKSSAKVQLNYQINNSIRVFLLHACIFAIGEQGRLIIPTRGNVLFPVWEHFIPSVGIKFSLKGFSCLPLIRTNRLKSNNFD